jgi:hypothetical protein
MEKKDMPGEHIGIIQRIHEYGLLGWGFMLFMYAWAGTVRTIERDKPTFWGWIADMIICGFVGLSIAMLCQYLELDYLLATVISCVVAHKGTNGLNIVWPLIKTSIGMGDEKKKPK